MRVRTRVERRRDASQLVDMPAGSDSITRSIVTVSLGRFV